jgi:ketosteroid isomerase-like protein
LYRQIKIFERADVQLAASTVSDAIAATCRLLVPDFKLVQANSLPHGGTYIGAQGISIFFNQFFAFWKTFKSVDVQYVESDDKVFATSTIIGTTHSETSIEMRMIQLFVVREGKLISAEPFYFDTAKIANKQYSNSQ